MARPRLAVLLIALALLLSDTAPAGAGSLDTVVGVVGPAVVTASDVALARAFGFLGFSPSEKPIASEDVDRYDAALAAVLEASRLGIGPTAEEVDRAWGALEAQQGGAAALRDWLDATAIDPAWVRQALETHLRWRTWTTLHQGLTIETPGSKPGAPALESDLVTRNLVAPGQTVPIPFTMPPRAAP
jgi:hypothetical protein